MKGCISLLYPALIVPCEVVASPTASRQWPDVVETLPSRRKREKASARSPPVKRPAFDLLSQPCIKALVQLFDVVDPEIRVERSGIREVVRRCGQVLLQIGRHLCRSLLVR